MPAAAKAVTTTPTVAEDWTRIAIAAPAAIAVGTVRPSEARKSRDQAPLFMPPEVLRMISRPKNMSATANSTDTSGRQRGARSRLR